MTKLHLIYIMYERARSKLDARNVQDPNIKKIIMTVLANFALKQLLIDNVDLYESGFFGPGSSDLLDAAYKQTLIDLRPQMIGLCELTPDGVVSSIGNEYGDIYETQFNVAKESPMNNHDGVPDLYYTHMRPVMRMNPPPKL